MKRKYNVSSDKKQDVRIQIHSTEDLKFKDLKECFET